ncbi:MAG: 2,3-bisphosphoglycerate-independent phosphoglycerate mutase [Coriobacteriales bacterium]|jgi:2,3-bisphosphoglycerate-independent phosphoglycerate mutase
MKPVLLVIMDGFGLAPDGPGNAISLAEKPYFDKLWSTCPHTTLGASGRDVGLPDGQMGNSEVGHLNMGSGRVVRQELTRINDAVADGSIEQNEVLCKAFDKAINAGRAIHLMGLLSDGGVHSNIEHLEALIEMAAKRGARDIRIHAFMDGRDVDPESGAGFIQRIVDFGDHIFNDYHAAQADIATISGRYYAMDRDNRWERIQQAWNAICLGQGKGFAKNRPVDAVKASYKIGKTDEFIIPTVLDHRGVNDGDTVVFFNFRPDRARQLTRAFIEPDFDEFDRVHVPDANFVCMTEYDATFDVPVAFPKTFPENTLADYLAANGLTQYHTAETEKYAHVTFFFNGGVEEPKEGESRKLIASPKVATYDLKPEMSEPEVTETLEQAIQADAADVYIVNYANCDMVGHTGVIEAATQAVEAVDHGLSHVVEAVLAKGGAALVTADHGNADKMLSDDGKSPFTAHTTNRVPFILVSGDKGLGLADTDEGRLADVAPTLVDILGLAKPAQWDGNSLLRRA